MSELTIEILRLSLNMNEAIHKSHVANIANSHNGVSGKQSVNFDSLLTDLRNMPPSIRLDKAQQLLSGWSQLADNNTKLVNGGVDLDNEVAKATLASGAYKKSIELLNRQLGLMQLAVKGGKGR